MLDTIDQSAEQAPDFIPVQQPVAAAAPTPAPTPTPLPAARGQVRQPVASASPDFIPASKPSTPAPAVSPAATKPAYSPYDAEQFNKPVPKEDSGIAAGASRLGKSLLHFPATVWDAFSKPPQNDEEKALADVSKTKYKGDAADAQFVLGIKRLVFDPMTAERELGKRYGQAAKDLEARTAYDRNGSNASPEDTHLQALKDYQRKEDQPDIDYTNHIANMHTIGGTVPVLGPAAAQMLDRYEHGDKSGAVFDFLAALFGPKVAEKGAGALLNGVGPIPGFKAIPPIAKKIQQYNAAKEFAIKAGPLTSAAKTDQTITTAGEAAGNGYRLGHIDPQVNDILRSKTHLTATKRAELVQQSIAKTIPDSVEQMEEAAPPTRDQHIAVVHVPPEDFLDKVGGAQNVNPAKVAEYEQAIKNGETPFPGHVTFDEEGNVVDADGRHRALAAANQGVERIPVRIIRRVPNVSEEAAASDAAITSTADKRMAATENAVRDWKNTNPKTWSQSRLRDFFHNTDELTPELPADFEKTIAAKESPGDLSKYLEQEPEKFGQVLASGSPDALKMYKDLFAKNPEAISKADGHILPFETRSAIRGGIISKVFNDALEPIPGIRPPGTIFDTSHNVRLNAGKFRDTLAKMSPEVKQAVWGDAPAQLESIQRFADAADILQKRAVSAGKVGRVAVKLGIPAEGLALLGHIMGIGPDGVHLAIGGGTAAVVSYRWLSNPMVIGRLTSMAERSVNALGKLQDSKLRGPVMSSVIQQNRDDMNDVLKIMTTEHAAQQSRQFQ